MAISFQHGSRRKAIEYEKDLVQYWKQNETFEKSVEQRPKDNAYVFYDGPPFITGVPHHGTLLSSIVKDAVPRYWTMKGKRVERTWGWDCHGLPAEVFTEKKLGIKDHRDIGTKISLEEYITTCRSNMVATGDLWEDTIDRIGRWVNFQGAYKTMDKDYMESVWWAFKQLYEKGKIYEGEKVLMYCTRDATPISKAEVAMDNSYQDVTDPSVYVKFKLKDEEKYLLAWTTTPWTLPSNSAVAVNKDLDYTEVEVDGEVLILAEELREIALTDEKHNVVEHTVIRTCKGKELVGKSYEPLFDVKELKGKKNAFKVWHADFVHADEGTGVAHESPAYGEDDYEMSKEKQIPWVMSTDEDGIFTMGDWKGEYVWDVNKRIAKELKERGVVWKIDYIKHPYPHCHRCGTKLMYRAHPSWFMDIEGQRQEMLEQNSDITWFPGHIKHGRFENTVESAPDWNISRDRFWATAMPVWKATDKDGKEHIKVVGSYQELKELSGVELDDYHRPWVDDVTFKIDGLTYTRIDKVLDCWFESGSMPFAQFHYPFENVEKFENNFPGDFIAEYVGQVRAWFYYLHAVNVGLFGRNAFKNVIVTGTLLGEDNRKLSKSLNNFTDPNELMDEYSADALRYVLLSSPTLAGEDFSLMDKDVKDTNRKLAMIWNMYDFFTMYAEVDKWQWKPKKEQVLPRDPYADLTNPLDQWIVSRVHEVTKHVDEQMQVYDVPSATRPLLELVDDASNWYVRRSRKRFWKSDNDNDKQNAYRTLHYVLTQIAVIFAPFTPFLSEELYRNLTDGESVHLLDWPEVGHVNELILERMELVRDVIKQGLAQRAQNSLKVRQPLQGVTITGYSTDLGEHTEELSSIIAEELNVKTIHSQPGKEQKIELDMKVTPALRQEGLRNEVIRRVQSARKKADLNVDDRIKLSLHTDDKQLTEAINKHKDDIAGETLAGTLNLKKTDAAHQQSVKIEDIELTIGIDKA